MTPTDVLAMSYLGSFLALLSAMAVAGLAYLGYRIVERLQDANEYCDQRRQEVATARQPYDSASGVAAMAAAAACCERWRSSAGTDHDPACPNHRSHA